MDLQRKYSLPGNS